MKLKLDLHEIYNKGGQIDRARRNIIDEAVRTKAPLVESIPRQGVRPTQEARAAVPATAGDQVTYHRVEKDKDNFERGLRALPLEIINRPTVVPRHLEYAAFPVTESA
ncbi:MAG TPA: DNA mismatch repair protein MutS [Sporichthyaceae bacterium]|nr:DNA mismatch repair protein MutS [Sporichthyaceae bacterium]